MTVETPVPNKVDIGILTVIPPELEAVRNVLGNLQRGDGGGLEGTIYLHGKVRSELRKCDYTVVLAGIGEAGNASASALAKEMIERHRPSVLLLVGIAAGMRHKVRIGDVVMVERVVAYEHEALIVGGDGTRQSEPRTKIVEIHDGMRQNVLHYQPDVKRLTDIFVRIMGTFPTPPPGKEEEWKEHVAAALTCKRLVTIASGEKLLRDPQKLHEVRRLHGKVEAGEMEAEGFAKACGTKVPWLVIRGISDFGDELKDDRFHELASRSAAAVLADFLANGLDLGERKTKMVPASREAKSPFVCGLPIDRDTDFFGRKREQGEILHAIDSKSPVQLLGGAKMGKSSLLRWVERHVPADRPVAWIAPGAGLSPRTLVAEMARKVNRPDLAERLSSESVTLEQVSERLKQLVSEVPLVLLMDDADTLATAGEGFTERFFQGIRGHIEDRRLVWVSASRRDLYDVFHEGGMNSAFFNSSTKLWVGPLDEDSACELASLGAPEHVHRLIDEAGHFAYGLQWLGDRLLRSGEEIDEARDAFRLEMRKRTFASWWEGLLPEERRLLRACVQTGELSSDGREESRLHLKSLKDRGFLMAHERRFRLAPGRAWQEFVKHAS
jgi:nucleoside phosphorylase